MEQCNIVRRMRTGKQTLDLTLSLWVRIGRERWWAAHGCGFPAHWQAQWQKGRAEGNAENEARGAAKVLARVVEKRFGLVQIEAWIERVVDAPDLQAVFEST